MKKAHAVSVLVTVSATVMMMGTPAFAAGLLGRADASGAVGRAGESVKAKLVDSAPAQLSCWTDRDRDDRTGRPTDHDGDESARCHAHANTNDHDHDHDSDDNVNDGDHDSDDAGPSRCFRDSDRDDHNGRPSDRDGDEAAHCRG